MSPTLRILPPALLLLVACEGRDRQAQDDPPVVEAREDSGPDTEDPLQQPTPAETELEGSAPAGTPAGGTPEAESAGDLLEDLGWEQIESSEVTIEGMAKARKVADLLFGSQPSDQALRQLAAEGYRTVLSNRAESETPDQDEQALVESLGMQFARIPMRGEVSDEQLDAFTEFMDECERPAVLHCLSGGRTATLFTIWLAEIEGLPPEQALDLGEAAGLSAVRPSLRERLGLPTTGSSVGGQ